MTSDDILLERWRAGDQDAGNALFERYFDPIWRFFVNKAGRATEDLVQQTFLACASSAHRFRGDASFRTWIYTIARSKLYDHLRAGRREEVDPSVTSLADLGTSPTRGLVRHEESILLQQALARLPVELQLAVELYWLEELPAPEVARILDVPEGTVRSRIRRATAALRDQITALAAAPAVTERTLAGLDRITSSRPV